DRKRCWSVRFTWRCEAHHRVHRTARGAGAERDMHCRRGRTVDSERNRASTEPNAARRAGGEWEAGNQSDCSVYTAVDGCGDPGGVGVAAGVAIELEARDIR